ncbi:MAG: (Fe-S)-binding protein, partial [Planctomycetes bacterium]|nr:(Fe-S)-binding protein [Planctomycetota bacterium]
HGKSMCCGAGGGWNWMEETIGDRISVVRTEQALKTDAEVIASACPFCLTMFEDACKALNKDEEIARFDIAEIIAQILSE